MLADAVVFRKTRYSSSSLFTKIHLSSDDTSESTISTFSPADQSLILSDEFILRGSFQTMFATESVLSRDWDTPEEDIAWSDL